MPSGIGGSLENYLRNANIRPENENKEQDLYRKQIKQGLEILEEIVERIQKRENVLFIVHRDGDGIGALGVLVSHLSRKLDRSIEDILERVKIFSTPWGCHPPPVNEKEYENSIESAKIIAVLDQTPVYYRLLDKIRERNMKVLILDHHNVNYPTEPFKRLYSFVRKSRRIAIVNPAWFEKNGNLCASIVAYDFVNGDVDRFGLFSLLLGAYCDRKLDHPTVIKLKLENWAKEFEINMIFERINSLISKMVYLSKIKRILPEVLIYLLGELYTNNHFNVCSLKAITSGQDYPSDAGILSSKHGRAITSIVNKWPEHSKIIRKYLPKHLIDLPLLMVSENLNVAFLFLDATLPGVSILNQYEDLQRYAANLFLAKWFSRERSWAVRENRNIENTYCIIVGFYDGKIFGLTGRKTDKNKFRMQNIGELMAKIASKISETLKNKGVPDEEIHKFVGGGGHPDAEL